MHKGIQVQHVIDMCDVNVPKSVSQEINEIQQEGDCLANGTFQRFKIDLENQDKYPNLCKYLNKNGLTECVLHIWW